MAKYRKKPVVIEAHRFFYDADSWPDGVYEFGDCCWVDTLEGKLKVSEGDWIITGIKGEKYPCKPDIFEQTYERVEE